jgi:hypothetical protein
MSNSGQIEISAEDRHTILGAMIFSVEIFGSLPKETRPAEAISDMKRLIDKFQSSDADLEAQMRQASALIEMLNIELASAE